MDRDIALFMARLSISEATTASPANSSMNQSSMAPSMAISPAMIISCPTMFAPQSSR